MKKYRQAGFAFLGLSVVYLTVAMAFVPSFHWDAAAIGSLAFVVALMAVLAFFIYRGKKLLVKILAVIYAGRSIFAVYSVIAGKAFPAVPYLIPCLLLTFYLLGRAAWDWP